MIRVTVWNEFIHEREQEAIRAVHPQGLHEEIAAFLRTNEDMTVRTVTLQDPDCGLPQEVLDQTDVLLWWGHMGHHLVPDEVAQRVRDRVLAGMGFIPLHSAHYSKPFKLLMGTSCSLTWRDDDFERVWCLDPAHPVAQGLPPYFELPHEEMYGEWFDVPTPDEVVFVGWFRGGEVFRSGCCWQRGTGRIFYFQPGHEEFCSYQNPHVQRILTNAVRWAAPRYYRRTLGCLYRGAGCDVPQEIETY